MRKKIIIIGAGLAGLAAANSLNKENFEVTILEADTRAGGRVLTDYSLGMPIDLGPFLLHGLENNHIADLCNQLGIKHVPFNSEHDEEAEVKYFQADYTSFYLFDKTLQRLDEKSFTNCARKFSELMETANQHRNTLQTDCAITEIITDIIHQGNYTELEKTFFDWNLHLFHLYFGMELKNISARYWDSEQELEGGNDLVVDGYDKIIDSLVAAVDIQFNTQVCAINYAVEQITLNTNQGEFTADAVIVTVPLSILKNSSLTFSPTLPENKQQAINRLEMGILNKIIMRFPACFWPKQFGQISSFAHYKDLPIFANYYKFLEENILMAGIAGQYAIELENKTDAEITQLMLNILKEIFGNDIPAPTNVIITRWHSNPFSQGCYSCLPPHASPADYATLAEPIQQKIFFAGEATHPEFAATAHGAYLSGLRAASEIEKTLR